MSEHDSTQELLPIADLALPLDTEPPRSRRIYCNRNLRLDQVQWIGFDMDYTLAIYNQDEMDRLSIEATAKKLVERGYPDELLHMSYQAHFPIRGLLVDKRLGNILKTDRYRYAKKAFHGTRELTSEERKRHYSGKRIRAGSKRYHSIDTLYGLSEVVLGFAAILAGVRGGLERRHRPLRAVGIELVLGIAGLCLARWLAGPGALGAAAGFWGYALVQSLYFLAPGGVVSRPRDAGDPFERARDQLEALFDQA